MEFAHAAYADNYTNRSKQEQTYNQRKFSRFKLHYTENMGWGRLGMERVGMCSQFVSLLILVCQSVSQLQLVS